MKYERDIYELNRLSTGDNDRAERFDREEFKENDRKIQEEETLKRREDLKLKRATVFGKKISDAISHINNPTEMAFAANREQDNKK